MFGVVGQVFKTADLAVDGGTYFHRFSPNIFVELKALQIWIVKYGSVSTDPIGLELRSSYASGNVRKLIATASNTWTPAQITSENYAVKQIYFEFDRPVLLRKDTEYTLNLKAANYVGTDDAHIAWVKAWPDPIVDFVGSSNFNRIDQFPFHVALIAREVRP